ncbi:MAG: YqgE/AlgH family protein [Nitrospirae bacterium]|nr:YqgE/AlgH family protein [Nitrospirota bacterium]
MRLAICLTVLCLAVGGPAAASDLSRPTESLKPGTFLFSAPQLRDPHFFHTVVLLVTYGAEGASGLVINRPTDISPGRAFPDLKGIEKLLKPVYFGGPVNQSLILALLRTESLPDGAQKVVDHIYVTASRKALADALQNRDPDKKVRVFFGYAGWGPGQLDREYGNGDWVVRDADPEAVFSEDPSTVWDVIMERREKIQIRTPNLPPFLPWPFGILSKGPINGL